MNPLTRSPHNPRRAYDRNGREIPPMTLATMREHGVRSVAAEGQKIGCGHAGSVNVDHLPGDFPVPDVALRLRCSACGSPNVKIILDWRSGSWARESGSGS